MRIQTLLKNTETKDLNQLRLEIDKMLRERRNQAGDPIEREGFSQTTLTALKKRNILRVEELQEYTIAEVASWYRVGPKVLEELMKAMKRKEIWFVTHD